MVMQVRLNRKLGIAAIVASGLMWVTILVIPFLPSATSNSPATTIAQKTLMTTSLAVVSEVLFWVGILLVGKEIARSYRQKLNPFYWWQKFRRRRF